MANFRFATEEQRKYIVEYMHKLEERVYVPGCKTVLEEKGCRPAMELVERNVELAERMNEIFEENGFPKLTLISKAGGSDAAQVTMAGIPCVDNLGCCGGGAHSVHEFAVKESLKEYAKRLSLVICEL